MGGKWLVAGLLIVSGELASAQAPPARPDPSDPQAVVAPTRYRSAFDGYRKQSAADVGSWREANENVGRIGGWREYLKEAHRPAPSTPSAPAVQTTPQGSARPAPSQRHPGH